MAIQFIPAPVTETPLTPQPPALVLFGRDRGGKPRAAWFDGHQAEAARAAADPMKLRALPLADDDQRALAAQLAHGRILPSGKAHVPGLRRDLYSRLVALAGESAGLSITERPDDRCEPVAVAAAAGADAVGDIEQAERPAPSEPYRCTAAALEPVTATDASNGPAKPKFRDHNFVGSPVPRERDEIGLGSVVLAHEGADEGWWEAEIIGMNGRVFSCRWRDYPHQGTFLRKRGELALMPPGEA
ncbi:hypothetical protein [Methylobacterium sp. Leaf466]|uniref:hypothetical protein n=1 Tax=Methylobacterium sp. Leaf466 TaxID=1736386 RepID=UPI000A9A9284|nr:hypothetical protein [Methylobacterium sp. Leaf466]